MSIKVTEPENFTKTGQVKRNLPSKEKVRIQQKLLDEKGRCLDILSGTGLATGRHTFSCRTCNTEWEAVLSNITRGGGCPKCAGVYRYTKEDYLSRCIETFPGYTFSLGNNPTSSSLVKYECLEGHSRSVSLNSILQGQGCKICAANLVNGKKRLTTQEALQRLLETHGDTYDYSCMNYTGSSNKITIKCKEHGAFSQEYSAHRKGQGCPKCYSKHNVVYFYRLFGDIYKIGVSNTSRVQHRISTVAYKHGCEYPEILIVKECSNPMQVESIIKASLTSSRYLQAKKVDGYTEMFELSEEEVLWVLESISAISI